MTKLRDIASKATNSIQSNSPVILTGIGVSGLLVTSYLTVKATIKAMRTLEHKHQCRMYDIKLRKEDVKHVAKHYIPPAVSAAATIACIIGANKAGSKRVAAAYSLLSVAERGFTEYKDKVVEQLGAKKEQGIHDEIMKDRMAKNPASQMIVIGTGEVLCYEAHTDRYFMCEIEKLKRAENEINAQMIRENEASLNDFYYMVGLPHTSFSSRTGWTSDKLLELRFSTQMSDDNRPCVCFEYNYVLST